MDLLGTFESLELATLEEYKARGQEEHLHLDCKALQDATLSSGADRKSLAEAVSGFGNSAGGLILWGVVARKGADGVDRIREFKPVPNVPLLISKLNEFTWQAADPPVPGVLHRAIMGTGESGFAATFVPESDGGPHMAKFGADRYMKRSGDRFYRMEHYDVGDMFGRRQKAALTLTARIFGKGKAAVTVVLALINEGRGSARAPYLAIRQTPPFRINALGVAGMRQLHTSGSTFTATFGEGADFTIHPGVEHQVTSLHLGLGVPPVQMPSQDLLITYSIACEGQPLSGHVLTIPLSDLV